MRVCAETGCPTLIPKAGRCPTHARAAERARGTRQARGYDATHDALRRRWVPVVARGGVICPKCRNEIIAADLWDLGHTEDRRAWTGPEHVRCNRSAAGRASHGLPPLRPRP